MSGQEENNVFVLTDENGNDVSFEHLDTFEMDDNTYVAMIPFDEETQDGEEVEVVIFELGEDDEGEDILLVIEDEEQMEKVYNELIKRMEEMDIDEEEQN